MKRADKEKVVLVINILLIICMPLLMDWIGVRWFIAGVCSISFLLLLWYSYGPIKTKAD